MGRNKHKRKHQETNVSVSDTPSSPDTPPQPQPTSPPLAALAAEIAPLEPITELVSASSTSSVSSTNVEPVTPSPSVEANVLSPNVLSPTEEEMVDVVEISHSSAPSAQPECDSWLTKFRRWLFQRA